jgi:hypothetical protein
MLISLAEYGIENIDGHKADMVLAFANVRFRG